MTNTAESNCATDASWSWRSLQGVLEVRGDLRHALALGLIPAVLLSLLAGVLVGLRA